MSDSVPSLDDIIDTCRSSQLVVGGDGEAELVRLIFTYSRHHDPAVKAAREAMGAYVRLNNSAPYCDRWEVRIGDVRYSGHDSRAEATKQIARMRHAALRLLDGKAVPHE